MRVLVTGGAGYIGSHVVLALKDEGHEPVVYDNLYRGTTDNLFGDVRFIKGDVLDEALLRTVLEEGWDGVIHLAALKAAGESMLKPGAYAKHNIGGTNGLLNAMAEVGCGKLVFSSSAAVYGEPRYLPIDEDHPTNPENFYGFTKLEAERTMAWFDRLSGIRFAALRYFNAAGYDGAGRVQGLEQKPANLIPVIMEAVVGMRDRVEVFGTDYDTADGTGVRDYVHVTDLADAHVRALDYLASADRSLVCNLGSESGLSVREVLEATRRISGRDIPVVDAPRRPGDPARLVAGSDRAAALLGWKASHSAVDEIVETTWRAYRRFT